MRKHPSIYIIDLSGKVLNYDYSLCKALAENSDINITFVAPHKCESEGYVGRSRRLLSFVPKRCGHSNAWGKRIVKALEGIINYHIFSFYILIDKPTVLHFQWFPFMEVCSVDIWYMAILRLFHPSAKIILTIHNVYPHDMAFTRKIGYNKRFRRMDRYIDQYIVHTNSTQKKVEAEFGVHSNRINAVPHGIFSPQYIKKEPIANRTEKSIILYGGITPYKGVDILLDAIQLLLPQQKECLHITIAGSISEKYLAELQSKVGECKVDFLPYFVPDNELYNLIEQSDYIALPYRNISQSGVLLLALYFRKPLLVADLPSFKETLEGFTDDMFFENSNPQALADLITRHLNNDIDTERQMIAIEHLNTIYSWEEAARRTYIVYKNCLDTVETGE